MYVVVVYDVEVERINKVRNTLKLFLQWTQNSVFEGELDAETLRLMTDAVSSVINKNRDSVVIYTFPKRLLNTEFLGRLKAPRETLEGVF